MGTFFAQLLEEANPTDSEYESAISGHRQIKEHLESLDEVLQDGVFLSGSYARKTCNKPLNDVDIIAVFKGELEEQSPAKFLEQVKKHLDKMYGHERVKVCYRCIGIDMKQKVQFDVVPVLVKDKPSQLYWIADKESGNWIPTAPRAAKDRMETAQRRNDSHLPLLRLLKYWNKTCGIHLCSFHLEVMTYSRSRKYNHTLTGSSISERFADLLHHVRVQFKCRNNRRPPGGGQKFGILYKQAEAKRIEKKLRKACEVAKEARRKEKGTDDEAAIKNWEKLFSARTYP